MSVISFLSAVGPFIDDDMGDLEYLTTTIDDNDIFYETSDPFTTIGNKITVTIPQDRSLVIYKAAVFPTSTYGVTQNVSCYVDVNYAGLKIDQLYFEHEGATEARGFGLAASIKKSLTIEGKKLHGDGTRKLDITVTGIAPSVSFQIILFGYYTDASNHVPNEPRNISAQELSPDDIKLLWRVPLDNGGQTITSYRIQRSENADFSSPTTISDTYSPTTPNDPEAGISYDPNLGIIRYDDTNLADNTTYYYKVVARNASGIGNESVVVSATTEIDHPAPPLNVTATKISSTVSRVSWNTSSDDGGVPLIGYVIERSLSETSGFAILVSDTGNTDITYDDRELTPGTTYYYRLKAINFDDRQSLTYSNVASVLVEYDIPTNLIHTVATDNKSVLLEWTAPVDVNNKPIAGYKIERGTDDLNFTILVTDTESNRTNYTDSMIQSDTVYYYRISVIADGIVGPASASERVVFPTRLPSLPRNFTVESISDSKITTRWDVPLDNGGLPILNYTLQRSKSIGFPDGTSASVFTQTNTPALPIQGQTVTTNTITVSAQDNAKIGSVHVAVNISHTWRGDVEIVITAPNGESFTLKNVDFTDSANDIIATYEGNIFNSLIGLDSQGDWTLKVRDAYSAEDDGTLDDWTLTIDPALDSLTEIDIDANLTEYTDTGLDAETTYFYRIFAVNANGNGDFSVTQNADTQRSVFGDGSDGDLVVPASTTVNIIGSKNYDNITIEDGGILNASSALIRCNGDYTENGTGKIVVAKTGCPGGMAGITVAGVGARDPYAGRSVTIRSDRGQSAAPQTPAVPAMLIPGTDAPECTDIAVAQDLISQVILISNFETGFVNQISGGQGSDGSDAATSGNGGSAGTRHTYNGSAPGFLLAGGGNGGNGGLAAQGVDGVIGGGKIALLFRNIITTLRVTAVGTDGLNGNQGTGTAGTAGTEGGRNSRGSGTAGTAGTAASTAGTQGSEGSQGGVVYVVYDTLTDTDLDNDGLVDAIDTSGGIGGFNGGTSTGTHPLTTKAADGDDGIIIISALADLI